MLNEAAPNRNSRGRPCYAKIFSTIFRWHCSRNYRSEIASSSTTVFLFRGFCFRPDIVVSLIVLFLLFFQFDIVSYAQIFIFIHLLTLFPILVQNPLLNSSRDTEGILSLKFFSVGNCIDKLSIARY